MSEKLCIRVFDGGKLKEEEQLEDVGVDVRIMLKCIFKK